MHDTQDEVEHSHSPLLKYTVLMSGWVLRMVSRTPGSKLDVGMELNRRREEEEEWGEGSKRRGGGMVIDLWCWTLMPQIWRTYLCWGKIARQTGTAKAKLKHNDTEL